MNETWTALILSDPGERIPPFVVWKVAMNKVTAAGPSRMAARARLAERLEEL